MQCCLTGGCAPMGAGLRARNRRLSPISVRQSTGCCLAEVSLHANISSKVTFVWACWKNLRDRMFCFPFSFSLCTCCGLLLLGDQHRLYDAPLHFVSAELQCSTEAFAEARQCAAVGAWTRHDCQHEHGCTGCTAHHGTLFLQSCNAVQRHSLGRGSVQPLE